MAASSRPAIWLGLWTEPLVGLEPVPMPTPTPTAASEATLVLSLPDSEFCSHNQRSICLLSDRLSSMFLHQQLTVNSICGISVAALHLSTSCFQLHARRRPLNACERERCFYPAEWVVKRDETTVAEAADRVRTKFPFTTTTALIISATLCSLSLWLGRMPTRPARVELLGSHA